MLDKFVSSCSCQYPSDCGDGPGVSRDDSSGQVEQNIDVIVNINLTWLIGMLGQAKVTLNHLSRCKVRCWGNLSIRVEVSWDCQGKDQS